MTSRRIFNVVLLSAVFFLAGIHNAEAQQTTGDVIRNVMMSWGRVTSIMNAVAWIAGAYLGVAAIFKFKDHVDNPAQTPISAGVKRMIAGGMFLALPYVIGAARGSLFGGAPVGSGKPTLSGFTGASAAPDGLEAMVVRFVSNVVGPMQAILTAFAYLSGIALLMSGIFRLTKRMEEGPRGPAGFGTIMTFITAAALFSFGDSMGAFTTSFFGDSNLMTNASIDTSLADVTSQAQMDKILEGVLLFVMIVGYIAFIRGWFVLKNFADGQQGATLPQGLTFLFGGTLAINFGELVNAVQNSVGVAGVRFQ